MAGARADLKFELELEPEPIFTVLKPACFEAAPAPKRENNFVIF